MHQQSHGIPLEFDYGKFEFELVFSLNLMTCHLNAIFLLRMRLLTQRNFPM